jgi:hypothetical protein
LLSHNKLASQKKKIDVDLAENMVAIPVPAPGVVIHTLVPVDVPQEFIPSVLHDPNPLEPEGTAIAHALASPSPAYVKNQEDDLMSHLGEADQVPEFWANI